MRFIFLLLVGFLISNSSIALAQEAVTKINARILPTIWYSSLDASEGDKLRIYAGIQNNSGISFSGSVVFYVDGVELSKVVFNSTSDSLKQINTEWKAVKGKHTFQAKVEPQLQADKKLLSYESEKVSLSVSHILTLEEIKEDATEAIIAVGEKIDESAKEFSETLESFKKQPTETASTSISKSPLSRTGTKVANQPVGEGVSNALLASVLNSGIDILQLLIKHWVWTLGGLAVLYLIFKFY